MQRAKLLKLADHLESLPRKKFNIGYWCKEDNRCGTVACAFGWCPIIFPRSGLKMYKEIGEIKYKNVNGTHWGINAAEEFFQINDKDARDIFLGTRYKEYHSYNKNGFKRGSNAVTPKVVAKRIRNFVETGAN
jgi:hypothetical protein